MWIYWRGEGDSEPTTSTVGWRSYCLCDCTHPSHAPDQYNPVLCINFLLFLKEGCLQPYLVMYFPTKYWIISIHLIISLQFETTAPISKSSLSHNYTRVVQGIVCPVSSEFVSESYDGSFVPTVSVIRSNSQWLRDNSVLWPLEKVVRLRNLTWCKKKELSGVKVKPVGCVPPRTQSDPHPKARHRQFNLD